MEHHLADVDAVVLAGGLGLRLRSIMSRGPKILAEVRERPFLDLLIAWLYAGGIRRILLALGHLGGHVEQRAQLLRSLYPDMMIRSSVELEPLGTGGALRTCLPMLCSDPVLVANGDSLVGVDFPAFLSAFVASKAGVGLVSAAVPDATRYGRLDVSPEGRILKFVEKDRCHVGPARINAGLYLFRREFLLESLPPKGQSSLENDLLGRLAPGAAMAFPSEGAFIDIGTPDSLSAAAETIAANFHNPSFGKP